MVHKVEMMKKLFSLFMIISLLFTLTACSNTPAEEGKDEVEEVEEVYVRGEWLDGVYTNDYLGFTFTLPDNWVLATDEELMSMLETSTEEMLSEEMKENYDKAIENAQSFYDFAIFNMSTGESIMMNIEDLSKTVGAILLNEDQFLDAVEGQLSQIENIEIEVIGRSDDTLAMGAFRVLELNYQDILTQKYYVTKRDKYMVSFIFSIPAVSSAGIDEVMGQLK